MRIVDHMMVRCSRMVWEGCEDILLCGSHLECAQDDTRIDAMQGSILRLEDNRSTAYSSVHRPNTAAVKQVRRPAPRQSMSLLR